MGTDAETVTSPDEQRGIRMGVIGFAVTLVCTLLFGVVAYEDPFVSVIWIALGTALGVGAAFYVYYARVAGGE